MKYLSIILILAITSIWAAAAPYKKPTTAQAVKVSLGSNLTGADLERIHIGNQAGVLKIMSPDKRNTLFLKGVDGRHWAPVTTEHRDSILQALELRDLDTTASALMQNYTKISRVPAVALLGILAAGGNTTVALEPEIHNKVILFLHARLQASEDATTRRQAVLALAIQPQTRRDSVAAMINFLRRDHNAWNTFGAVQFFEYHKAEIRAMTDFVNIQKELANTDSPHQMQILRDLNKT